MSEKSPLFIHAWWRSSSTYVWSKLRLDRSLQCFYEPLHEQIAFLSEKSIQSGPEVEMNRMLRHPDVARNYFFEYLHLVRSSELHYSPDIAYERYLLRPDQCDIKLYTYIDGLISAAANEMRRAVLCFCRSQMRSCWMKQNFVGTHIAQIRNPFDQWASFQVNPYFIRRMILIALALRNIHPNAFSHVLNFERQAREISFHDTSSGGRINEIQLNRKDCFRIFMIIWIASALQSITSADFVMDVDALSNDADCQKATSRYFQSLGCIVDFSDCSVPKKFHGTNDVSDGIEELVHEAIKAIQSNAQSLVISDTEIIATRLPTLTYVSRRILSSAIECT